MSKLQDKFMDFLENKFMPVMGEISNQRHVNAVKNGMIGIIPFTILGSIMLIVRFPPIDPNTVGADPNFIVQLLLSWKGWADAHGSMIMMPFNMTMALLGIFAVIGISDNLAKHYKLNQLSAIMLSLMSYLVVTAPATDGALPMAYLDAKGLFTAIIVGIVSVEILKFMDDKNLEIKMPDGVPPAVANSFASLIPAFALMIIFYGLSLLVQNFAGMLIPEAIMAMMRPLVGAVDSVYGVFFTVLLCQLLWFAGIHGATTVGAVLTPFLIQNFNVNAQLRMAGEAMQYSYTRPMWSFMICLGGSGATLALAFLMANSKSKQLSSVGKIAILPGLFNINEPIIFGAPIVLNPIMFFPFVFISPILGVLSYIVTDLGLITKGFAMGPWTTPAPIGAFIATLDWRAVVWVFILFILSGIMYYPFFKVYEKQLLEEERANAEEADNVEEAATA